MKQYILFSFLFFHFTGVCQLKVYNESLISKDSAVVYIGISNHLIIEGQQNISKFKVTSTNSEISINNNYLVLRTNRRGMDTIRIYSNKKLLSTNIFRIDRINNPVAQLAFTLDSVISLNRILANPYLSVKIPNSLYDMNISIVGFQCSIQKANSNNYIYTDVASGNKLTNDMLKLIQKLVSGDKLVFDEIRAIAPGSEVRKLSGITIIIR